MLRERERERELNFLSIHSISGCLESEGALHAFLNHAHETSLQNFGLILQLLDWHALVALHEDRALQSLDGALVDGAADVTDASAGSLNGQTFLVPLVHGRVDTAAESEFGLLFEWHAEWSVEWIVDFGHINNGHIDDRFALIDAGAADGGAFQQFLVPCQSGHVPIFQGLLD